jgi:hypothetical protein
MRRGHRPLTQGEGGEELALAWRQVEDRSRLRPEADTPAGRAAGAPPLPCCFSNLRPPQSGHFRTGCAARSASSHVPMVATPRCAARTCLASARSSPSRSGASTSGNLVVRLRRHDPGRPTPGETVDKSLARSTEPR